MGNVARGGQLDHLVNELFDFLEMFLPEKFHIFRGHKGAFSLNGVEKTFFFQFVVGSLGGDEADAQVLGQTPDGGQLVVFLQGSADDLGLPVRRRLAWW